MKKILALIIICISTIQLFAQNMQHLKVQRLNDSYIDVYIHNKHPEKKMPLLILCQGSGYDSNTEGFLGVAAKFDEQVAGLMIEKQGVQ